MHSAAWPQATNSSLIWGWLHPLIIVGALADHLDRLSTRLSVENERFEIGLWGNDAALALSELGPVADIGHLPLRKSGGVFCCDAQRTSRW